MPILVTLASTLAEIYAFKQTENHEKALIDLFDDAEQDYIYLVDSTRSLCQLNKFA